MNCDTRLPIVISSGAGLVAKRTNPAASRNLVSAEGNSRHSLQESRPRLRILLAEDNSVNQKIAVHLLEKWGHRVIVASNGRDAVSKWKEQSFDLVLMDVPITGEEGLRSYITAT
jgi:PleD family two-component response regulator